jgi:hypothetical protein
MSKNLMVKGPCSLLANIIASGNPKSSKQCLTSGEPCVVQVPTTAASPDRKLKDINS